MQAMPDSAPLIALCEDNGISEEQFLHRRHNVTNLEMVSRSACAAHRARRSPIANPDAADASAAAVALVPASSTSTFRAWWSSTTSLPLSSCAWRVRYVFPPWTPQGTPQRLIAAAAAVAPAARPLQEISRIEGLQGCPNLENLWVIEANLSEISGLDSCSR